MKLNTTTTKLSYLFLVVLFLVINVQSFVIFSKDKNDKLNSIGSIKLPNVKYETNVKLHVREKRSPIKKTKKTRIVTRRKVTTVTETQVLYKRQPVKINLADKFFKTMNSSEMPGDIDETTSINSTTEYEDPSITNKLSQSTEPTTAPPATTVEEPTITEHPNSPTPTSKTSIHNNMDEKPTTTQKDSPQKTTDKKEPTSTTSDVNNIAPSIDVSLNHQYKPSPYNANNFSSNPDNDDQLDGNSGENKKKDENSFGLPFLLVAGVVSIGLVAVSSYRVLKSKSESRFMKGTTDFSTTNTNTTSLTANSIAAAHRSLKLYDAYGNVVATNSPSTIVNEKGLINAGSINATTSRLIGNGSYPGAIESGYGATTGPYSSILNSILYDEEQDIGNLDLPYYLQPVDLNKNTYPSSITSGKDLPISTVTVSEADGVHTVNTVNAGAQPKRSSLILKKRTSVSSLRYAGSISSNSSVTSLSRPSSVLRDTSILRHSFLNSNIKIVRINKRAQQLFEETTEHPAIIETFPSLERPFVPAVPVPIEEADEDHLHPYQIYQACPQDCDPQQQQPEGDFENYYAYTIEDKEYIIDPATNRVLEIHDLATDEYMMVEEELYLDFSGSTSSDDSSSTSSSNASYSDTEIEEDFENSSQMVKAQ